MIVTVGNTKGGVGKTTLALHIAIARARAGQRVWLVDSDVQGTAVAALTMRHESQIEPGVACAHYPNRRQLHSQLMQQRPAWDEIIIDAGGRDTESLRAALVVSDVVVVPFAPRSYDVWALDDIAQLIELANEAREDVDKPNLTAYAVLNQADPGQGAHAADNRAAADVVKDFDALQYLPTPITRRKALSNAAGEGRAVWELTPRDSKAVREMEALVDALFEQPRHKLANG